MLLWIYYIYICFNFDALIFYLIKLKCIVSLLNRSVSNDVLSPAEAWNGGQPVDIWSQEALEYCWLEMKRLGKTQGSIRDQEWNQMITGCKRSRVNSDSNVIMNTVSEYAENSEAETILIKVESSELSPSCRKWKTRWSYCGWYVCRW